MTQTIQTEYNGHEWTATFDGYDGAPDAAAQPVGFGPTEDAAIWELKIAAEDMGIITATPVHTATRETCHICRVLSEKETATNVDIDGHGEMCYPVCETCMAEIGNVVTFTDGSTAPVVDGLIEYAAQLDEGLSKILGFDVNDLPPLTPIPTDGLKRSVDAIERMKKRCEGWV